ncbi:hypothetical protein [Paenibacillus xylanexedens]|uniref:hypothetical protein n=1 Tax=Paenibacillus xylanexedens TaxID=528191 RepID=UPI0011A54202|nr:hypothetical protein [Paenibacillus xylanexedens]
MRKGFIITVICLLMILGFGAMQGFHIDEAKAIPRDADILKSEHIDGYGQVVYFEDNQDRTFGIALLEERFGFLHRYGGGSWDYFDEQDKPFETTGYGNRDHFVVGVKAASESNIKYIAIGNHMENLLPSQTYELSLEDVKASPDVYHLKEMSDLYALFVLNEYTEDTWTIRAFNQDGKLVADKLFGAEERYLDEEVTK